MEQLTDSVAVITVGASGIGLASALHLAVAELSANGATVEGVVCDVSDL